ncbi:MAG: DUF6056 family protein [Lachnospiraceae bacterium]
MRKKQTLYYWSIILITLLSLLPLFVISFYAHPCADDYNYAIQTHTTWADTHSPLKLIQSAVQTSADFWHTWQGLYSSAFVLALQPAIFGEQYYALTGIFMLSIILGSNFLLCWYLLHRCLKAAKLEAAACGCILSFLMIQWMPSVVEGLYWFNGAMNYVLFYGVFICLLCLLISMNRCQVSVKSIGKILLLCLLGIFLAGGNHITAFCGIILLGCFLIFTILQKKKAQFLITLLAEFCAISGFLFNVTSPGTKNRQARFVDRPGAVKAILKSIQTGAASINGWIGIAVIVGVILLFPLAWRLTKNLREQTGFSFRYPLLVVIGSAAWICMMFCPTYYAMNSSGAGRSVNIVYFFFIILLFVDTFYIIGWLTGHVTLAAVNSQKYWYTSAAVFAIGVCLCCGTQSCAFQALQCLRDGSAKQYSTEANARIDLLTHSAGKKVTLQPYTVKPGLLFFDDITTDPKNWKNKSLKKYYCLRSVVLAEE